MSAVVQNRIREHFSLQPGEWFRLQTEEDELSDCQKAIYDKKELFFVVTREDFPCDPCRCDVIDSRGEVRDYRPATQMLDSTPWAEKTIVARLSETDIHPDLVARVKNAVRDCLNSDWLKDYCKKYEVWLVDLEKSGSVSSHTSESRKATALTCLADQYSNSSIGGNTGNAALFLLLAATNTAKGEWLRSYLV